MDAQVRLGGCRRRGTFIDYIALSDASHVLSLSDDGKTILVNDSVPVRAIWKGGEDATAPANWTCYDDAGDVIANKLPGMYVTNITLEADCDFKNWNGGAFHSGAVIDLMGHALEVVNLPNAVFPNAVITNSADATTATLGVTVASGVTVSDATAAICGNVKFVKRGAGMFVAARAQSYTGGTEVAGGMLKANKEVAGSQFGVPVSDADLANIEVASGAVFDFAQKCGWGGYRMTLAGGTLQNSGGGFGDEVGGTFTNIVIAAEGSCLNSAGADAVPWGVFGNGTGSSGYASTSIDLGSHTLTLKVNWFFKLCNTTITGDGNFVVTRSERGYDVFQTGVKGRAHANGEIAATNVNFRIENQMRLYAPLSLHDYEAACDNLAKVGLDSTAEMKVFGTFRPGAHNAFFGCTMQDGSAIDLSNRTGEGALPFHLTCAMTGDSASCAYKSVTFVPGATVTVDLSGCNVKSLVDTYVLTWDEEPPASVRFVPDARTKSRDYSFVKDANGLRLRAKFVIVIR